MSPRHLALVVAAVAILGVGLYLFVQVRATPAQADVTPAATPPRQAAPVGDPAAQTAAIERGRPAWTPSKGPPTPAPATPPGAPPEEPPAADEAFDASAALKPNVKLDAVMDQANKAYDRQDFEEAKLIAGKVLQKAPTNIRMMRIMVSASCIDGDVAIAQKYYEQLPKSDREQMKMRCDRYGVTFKDPP